MFEEFLGLPLHPLAVHAPVVLVPLLAAVSLTYALVPKVRRYVGWVALLLAVGAPVSVALARVSGQAYEQRMYGPHRAPAVAEHAGFGDRLLWSALGLGLATCGLLWLRHRTGAGARRWPGHVLTVLVVVLAGLCAYYVFQSGHSGAQLTHGGR